MIQFLIHDKADTVGVAPMVSRPIKRGCRSGDAGPCILSEFTSRNFFWGTFEKTPGVFEMNKHRPMRIAGTAMLWQAFQMGGVKVLYMVRLLVLAILLTPADFGLIAIALAATGFLLNLTNFGLIPAAVQAKDMDESRYNAVWTFDLIRSVIVTFLTILFAPLIAQIFAEPRAIPIIQALRTVF